MVKRITGMLCALALLVSMVTVSVSAASDGASVAKPMLSLAEAEIIPFFGEGNDNFDFPQTTGRFYSNTLGNFLSVETWRKAGVEVIANFGDYDMDAFQFAFNLHFKNGANVYAGRNVVTFIAGDLELVFTRNSGNFDFDVSASYAGEALALSSTSLLALPFGDYGYNTEGHKALYQTFKEATPPEDDTADQRMALDYFPTMVYPLSITVSGGRLSICNRYSPTAASITATLENPDFTQANVSLSLLGRSGTSFFCGDVVGSYNGIANGGDGGVDLPVDDTEGMMPDTANAILTPYYGEGQTGFDYPQTTGCFVSEEIGSFLSVETERSTGVGLTADYGRYDMDSFMFGFALCFKNGTEYAGRNVVTFTAGDLVVTFTRNGEDFGYDIAATYAGQPLALAVTSTGADNVVEMGYNTEEQQNVYDMFLAATPPEDGAADKRMGQDAFATAVMPVLILYEDGMLYIGAPVTEEDLETGIIEADLEFADADVSLNVFGKDGISVICAGMTGMVFETGSEPPRDVETTEMGGLDQATCEIPEDLNWNSAGSGLGKTSLTGDALFVGGQNAEVNLTAKVGTYAIDSYFKLNFDLFAKTGNVKNGIAEGNENWVVTVGDFEFTFTRPTLGDADLNEHTMLQSVTFKGEELAIQGETVYTRDHRVTHDFNDPKTVAAANELKQYTEDNSGRLGWMFTNGLPSKANFWPTFHHSVEIVYDNGEITVIGGIGNDTGVAPAVATVDATSVVDTTQELGACEVSVNAHATAARKTYISIIGNFSGVYEKGTASIPDPDEKYTGLVNIDGVWYYVVDGEFCEETTLVNYYDVWYYVENGVLNWDYTGLVNYYGTWYYVENGVLNWGYTGLTNYYGTWYYVENGVLNWDYTGLTNYYGTWYYVENGILNWNATTLTNYYGTWYYVENGVLNWGYTGLTNYYGTWYYVDNGVLNWGATTLVNYYGTWYYVENGVLNWNANLWFPYYGTYYSVVNGVIVF